MPWRKAAIGWKSFAMRVSLHLWYGMTALILEPGIQTRQIYRESR
jgi:hypothetical protein